MERGAQIFVPFGCILEFANHLADVKSGGDRKRLADELAVRVAESFTEGRVYTIIPAAEAKALPTLLRAFVDSFVLSQIGLVDAMVIHEARRLHEKYAGLGYKVHIWTTDDALKPYEPDTEPDAYVG